MLTIFGLHGLGPPPESTPADERRYWVPVDLFRALVERLRGRPDVRFSFDDGLDTDRYVALPVLRETGTRAHFFVLVGRLDTPGHLRRDDVLRLREAGMVIGSHGMHHRRWPVLGEAALTEELVEARERLAHLLGEPVNEIAIPFGSYDRYVLRRLRELGYGPVYTSDGGRSEAGRWLHPRTTVTADSRVDDLLVLVEHGESLPLRLVRAAKRCWKRSRRIRTRPGIDPRRFGTTFDASH